MAARFWRLVCLQSYSGGDLELSALHLFDGIGRADAGAGLSCSHAPAVGDLDTLLDADLSATCRWPRAQAYSAGFFFMWDLGVGVEKDVIGVRVGSGASSADFLAGCMLQWLSPEGWTTAGSLGRIAFPGAATLAALVALGDPDYPSVVLLARAEGAPGSTTFVDRSQASRVVTARGGAVTSSAVTLFGQPMMAFNGSTAYAECESGAGFNLDTDFTLELWVHPLSSDSTQRWIFANYTNSAFGGIGVLRQNGLIGVIRTGFGPLIYPGTQQAPTGQLSYIRITRAGATMRLEVNGVLSGSVASTNLVPSGQSRIGIAALCADSTGTAPIAGTFFHGYVALRLTKGVARSGGIPSAPFPEALSIGAGTFPVQSVRLPLVTAAAVSMQASHATGHIPVQTARDVEFGGGGRLWGTTKTEISPGAFTPTKARVSVLRQRDMVLARQVWSDPATGAWEVSGLDTAQTFIEVAQHVTGEKQAVAADQTVPVPVEVTP